MKKLLIAFALLAGAFVFGFSGQSNAATVSGSALTTVTASEATPVWYWRRWHYYRHYGRCTHWWHGHWHPWRRCF